MNGRPILVAGDPRLRQRCEPVAAITGEVRDDIAALVDTLAEFRARHGFGRAIAAPQIGVLLRILAIDLGVGAFVVINPEITWRSDETFELWDDCFSVPDRLVRVRRHRSVTVHHLDEALRPRVRERLPEAEAELVQHEIDHLDGILMLDRAFGPDPIRPASDRGTLIDAVRAARTK